MTNLNQTLGRMSIPPPVRNPDLHRKDRIEAKRLAAERGMEIEKLRDGGWNVWPPKGMADADDPFHGDHYCNGWAEIYVMVRTYWGRV